MIVFFLSQIGILIINIAIAIFSLSSFENIKRKGVGEGEGVILHFYFYLTFLLAPMMSSSSCYQGILFVLYHVLFHSTHLQ